jgi:hypothetical protein
MSREWWHSFLLMMQTGRNGELKAAAQRDVLCRAAANLIHHTAVRCTVSVA